MVKSAGLSDHLTDLHVAFESMNKYRLRMNPLKCVFGVPGGRFLGFTVHEHGIQIDPKKVDSIRKLEEPLQERCTKIAWKDKLSEAFHI